MMGITGFKKLSPRKGRKGRKGNTIQEEGQKADLTVERKATKRRKFETAKFL
jgi:hypothetical protein